MFGFLFGYFMRIVAWVSDALTSSGRFVESLFYRGLDGVGRLGSLDRSLGALFYRLTWPFRRTSQLLQGGGESRGAVARFFAWIFGPLFRLLEWLDRIGRPRERVFDERAFSAEERRLRARLSQDATRYKVTRELDRSWVTRLGRLALTPFSGLGYFSWQLLRTRRAGMWLWGLPLVLVSGLLASTLFIKLGQDTRVVAQYESALSQAIKAGDSKKAELYRLKLAQLGSSTKRGEFQTALALAERGEMAAAYEVMQTLAPLDQAGLEGAHFWIARHLIEGALPVQAPQSLNLALQHLEQLRTRVGDEPEVRLLEGLANARLGRIPAAVNSLLPIADKNVVAAFLLMEIYGAQGKVEPARQQAVLVHRHLTRILDQGESLTEDQQKWRMAATRVIGDARLAAESVEQWYQANPDSIEARLNRTRLLLNQVAAWCNRPNPATLSETQSRLQQAAATVPIEQASMVTGLATQIAVSRRKSPELEALYQGLLADESVSGILLESFGTAAATEQDWELADRLLGRATAASPEWGNAWNNWAFVINTAFPERLLEALERADRAVALDETNPDYRETRGMVHYRLKNYEQAIDDLEIAINGVNELEAVHAALADSHRRLGNTAVADVYDRQRNRRQN